MHDGSDQFWPWEVRIVGDHWADPYDCWVTGDGVFSTNGLPHSLDLIGLAPPIQAVGDDHDAVTFHALPVADVPQIDVKVSGIGDISSNTKGSGARYNAGKTPYFLTPMAQIGASFLYRGALTPAQDAAARALQHIGDYQSRACGTEALYRALMVLGLGGWEECARVFEYGKAKYLAWNWTKGMPWSVPLECAARHLIEGILDGEDVDPESKLPHRGHVFCNLVMLIAYDEIYREGDDRPAAGALAPVPAANDETAQAAA